LGKLDRIQLSLISDYVGFIKKIMKQMQTDYPMIAKIEVELTQEKEMDHLPNRPSNLLTH